MALLKREYFPELTENGELNLHDLMMAHELSVHGAVNANLNPTTYYNALGNEVFQQLKNFKSQINIADKNLLERYEAFKNSYLLSSEGLEDRKKATLASKYHREFAKEILKYAENTFGSDPQKKKALKILQMRCAFLQKQPSDFYKDFANRTAIPMENVIKAITRAKEKEVRDSSLSPEEKQRIIAYILKESESMIKEFADVRSGVSYRERNSREYTYDASAEQEEQVTKIADGYTFQKTFIDMDRKDLSLEFPLAEKPLDMATKYQELVSFGNQNLYEMRLASAGEYGFSTRRFMNEYVNESMASTTHLSHEEIDEYKKHARRQLSGGNSFAKTGTTLPTIEEYRKSYVEYKRNLPRPEDFCKAVLKNMNRLDLYAHANIQKKQAQKPIFQNPQENQENTHPEPTQVAAMQ